MERYLRRLPTLEEEHDSRQSLPFILLLHPIFLFSDLLTSALPALSVTLQSLADYSILRATLSFDYPTIVSAGDPLDSRVSKALSSVIRQGLTISHQKKTYPSELFQKETYFSH